MLLTALLAVQATYTAKADTIYSGHYYDNGKEMSSTMPKPAPRPRGNSWIQPPR